MGGSTGAQEGGSTGVREYGSTGLREYGSKLTGVREGGGTGGRDYGREGVSLGGLPGVQEGGSTGGSTAAGGREYGGGSFRVRARASAKHRAHVYWKMLLHVPD